MTVAAATCTGQWKSSSGSCLECGKIHELRHQHRFIYYRIGDTMMTCEDCHQVVFISPEEAARIAGDKPVDKPLVRLPELLWSISGGVLPDYARIVDKYDKWWSGQ